MIQVITPYLGQKLFWNNVFGPLDDTTIRIILIVGLVLIVVAIFEFFTARPHK